jgi:hypothetical protein
MANRPSAEEEYKQAAESAGSVAELSLQKVADIVGSFPKARYESRYLPPPPTLLPVQRQEIHIVINLIVDLPVQE